AAPVGAAAPVADPARAGAAQTGPGTADIGPKPSFAEPAKPSFEAPAPASPRPPLGNAGLTKPSFAADDYARGADGLGETAPASPNDWVFETEPDIDPSPVDVKPLDTVEEGVRRAKEDTPTFGQAAGGPIPPPPAPEPATPAV